MDVNEQPAAAPVSAIFVGVMCGVAAAFGWAAGFVAAKHGVSIGFSPADLAFHRFFWTGLVLLPAIFRTGIADLGGIGWGRGVLMSVLSGPPQAITAYTGFILVPLGHGTTIQPACAALFGLILATLVLGEAVTPRRIIGAVAIISGLMVFGAESITTIGSHGVAGDMLFVTAGIFWAVFGTLLRRWHISGTHAVVIVGALSVLIYAPAHALLVGYDGIMRMSLADNLFQIFVQGLLAGALPIYLFARSIVLLGAGRAATFPALVPGFSLIIGYLALGAIPTLAQLLGLLIVVVGFRFVLRP